MKIMEKGDFIVIGIIILISLGMLYGFTKAIPHKGNEKYISIQIGGNEAQKIYFTEDNIGKHITIDNIHGYNVLLIEDNKCRLVESKCPDKICMLQGWISEPGEMLVCLPHHLVVEIKTSNQENQLDIINR
ncbi:MAG: NusG domain II-containing protein [Tissierellia bacterium]|nr:NusG domain II-containing protein [Tissierellia bacterium]